MTRYIVILILVTINQVNYAQIASRTDTLWLSVYNTGVRYELKKAPFGEQTPRIGVVKRMVFAPDTFEVKKNTLPNNFKAPTHAELTRRINDNKPPSTPRRATEADIARVKNNAAKRSCNIAINGLKDKIVLVDFDKNCDPTFKCLQAQKAGAAAVVVIFDTNRKDSIAMVRGRYGDSLRIPCFSIIRSQGDSLRVMLPSQASISKPQVRPAQSSVVNDSSSVITQQQVHTNQPEQTITTTDLENNVGLVKQGFSISPNPTRNQANIAYQFTKPTDVTIEAKVASGQVIFSRLLRGATVGNLDIQTADWANGTYFVTLQYGKEVQTKKLVVRH